MELIALYQGVTQEDRVFTKSTTTSVLSDAVEKGRIKCSISKIC